MQTAPVGAADLADAVGTAANPQGGWGYSAGKTSRLEPTCWALLALARNGAPDSVSWDAHLTFLRRCQQASGLLADDPALPPNAALNGLAAFTLLQPPWTDAPEASGLAAPLVAALVREKGVRGDPAPQFRQDNSLQGWPWVPHTFSWVEPTAWCLLALKTWARRTALEAEARARVDEGERLLLDRACEGGGWNYGNAAVFEQDLRPYVPTTALALLALQDRRGTRAVDEGWAWLRAHGHDEPSGMALALTMICVRVYDGAVSGLAERLVEQWARTRFLDNLLVTAIALYALEENEREEAFRL